MANDEVLVALPCVLQQHTHYKVIFQIYSLTELSGGILRKKYGVIANRNGPLFKANDVWRSHVLRFAILQARMPPSIKFAGTGGVCATRRFRLARNLPLYNNLFHLSFSSPHHTLSSLSSSLPIPNSNQLSKTSTCLTLCTPLPSPFPTQPANTSQSQRSRRASRGEGHPSISKVIHPSRRREHLRCC